MTSSEQSCNTKKTEVSSTTKKNHQNQLNLESNKSIAFGEDVRVLKEKLPLASVQQNSKARSDQ